MLTKIRVVRKVHFGDVNSSNSLREANLFIGLNYDPPQRVTIIKAARLHTALISAREVTVR